MGAQSVSTVVALQLQGVVGLKSASMVVGAHSARSAVGLESATTVVSAQVQGVRGGSICEHGRER